MEREVTKEDAAQEMTNVLGKADEKHLAEKAPCPKTKEESVPDYTAGEERERSEAIAPPMKPVRHSRYIPQAIRNEVMRRDGLTAEQIVRLGVLRSRAGATYRELEYMTINSLSVRAFLNLPPGVGLKKSAINANLKGVSEATWSKINECIKAVAVQEGMEDGKSFRGDTTTTKTNIHYPTDASLLVDGVRVLTRVMS